MKRIVELILSICICTSLVGCANDVSAQNYFSNKTFDEAILTKDWGFSFNNEYVKSYMVQLMTHGIVVDLLNNGQNHGL